MAKLIGYDFNFFLILAYSPNIGKEIMQVFKKYYERIKFVVKYVTHKTKKNDL